MFSRAAAHLDDIAHLVLVLCLVHACSPRSANNPLLDPNSPAVNLTAPETYRVSFSTGKGDFTIEVHRAWSPKGADRFFNLARNGFYDGARFFRVIRDPRPFVAQFGISADPAISARWSGAKIEDDPVKEHNTRGRIGFATDGPNTRTTQVFINYGDNSRLDSRGFSPFGEVTSGMDVVDQLYADYGEGAPDGKGPDQDRIEKEGTPYLQKGWPMLDYVKTARVVQ